MIKKIAIICFGSTMIGIGINGFILPFHLINGGIFGISLLLNYLFGLKTGLSIILLNIPVYLFAFKSAPLYFFNGILGAIISGCMIELLEPISGKIQLPIVSSVILGAAIIGIGVGVMLRNHISPGGMDLLSLLISKWTNVNVGFILFSIDTIIIVTALLLLQDAKLFYSLLIVTIVGLLASMITSFRSVNVYFK